MVKRFFSIFAGIILIAVGLIGFLVPILPGWLLIIAGILFISPHHGKKIVYWIEKKLGIKKNQKE